MCVCQVFDLASSCSLLHCANISMEPEAIHKDRSILLSNNSIRDYVLFAYRSDSLDPDQDRATAMPLWDMLDISKVPCDHIQHFEIHLS